MLAQHRRWKELGEAFGYACVWGVRGCHSQARCGAPPPVIPSILCEDHASEAWESQHCVVSPVDAPPPPARVRLRHSVDDRTFRPQLSQIIPGRRASSSSGLDDTPAADTAGAGTASDGEGAGAPPPSPPHAMEGVKVVELGGHETREVADAAVARAEAVAQAEGRSRARQAPAFVPASSPYNAADYRWGDIYKCLHVR